MGKIIRLNNYRKVRPPKLTQVVNDFAVRLEMLIEDAVLDNDGKYTEDILLMLCKRAGYAVGKYGEDLEEKAMDRFIKFREMGRG